MGKFDKYGAVPPRLPGAGTAVSTPTDGVVARLLADGPRQGSSSIGGRRAKIAIALDATGSMGPLIAAARQAIGAIIHRASREAERPIRIELFAFRDYDVPHQLLDRSGISTDPAQLARWLGGVAPAGGGGNDGEAVEAALDAVLAAGDFATVLLIGDEPSNSRANLTRAGKAQSPTAQDLARRLGEARTPVHGFVVGQSPRTIADFAEIARLSDGKSGRLDGSAEMIDLAVMAIIASLKGMESVRRYMAGKQLSANAASFGQLLLGGK